MSIYDNWNGSLPSQFKDKRMGGIYLQVWAEELQDVLNVFDDLKQLTDINKVEGSNLDKIGDIVVLSRSDAFEILRQKKPITIDDETYRKALEYKKIMNNFAGNYYDLMESLSLLWDTEHIRYHEDREVPATIFLNIQSVAVDGLDPAGSRVLAIRPAGVEIIYRIEYFSRVKLKELLQFNKLIIRLRFEFYDFIRWNGELYFNGVGRFDSVRMKQPAAVRFANVSERIQERIELNIIQGKSLIIS